MYCAAVFCLLMMDFLIPSKPASLVASFRVGYAQCLSPLLRSCLPLIRRADLCWKLSRACSILGVSNHVSAPNVAYSKRSRIGRIVMYCATVLCLQPLL